MCPPPHLAVTSCVATAENMASVVTALETAVSVTDRPTAIVAETQKGFGILPILEEAGDLNFHGQALSAEVAEKALAHLG